MHSLNNVIKDFVFTEDHLTLAILVQRWSLDGLVKVSVYRADEQFISMIRFAIEVCLDYNVLLMLIDFT